MELPPEGNKEKIKVLEREFLDPEVIDIFTEDEASYNAMILKKQDAKDEKGYSQDILEELYFKSKKTVIVLCDYLLLSKNKALQEILDMLEEERIKQLDGQIITPKERQRQGKIQLHKAYNHLNLNACIKLLLRIGKLYTALADLKKII